MRTCPAFAAENIEDNLLLKNNILNSQVTVATFFAGDMDKNKMAYFKFLQDFVYQKLFRSTK